MISGPNLAAEIARGEPAATVVASAFDEVVDAGIELLMSGASSASIAASDMIGVEWAGTLKNILAIAAGALDAMKFGWNARAMLITRGLAEMVRFGVAMGAKAQTFLGPRRRGRCARHLLKPALAATTAWAQRLAQGEKLDVVLEELGATAEGVRTTQSVWTHAQANGISMPITQGVSLILEGKAPAQEVLKQLMSRPALAETD